MLTPEGKLLVVAAWQNSLLRVALFDANGQPDPSFGATGYRTVDVGEALFIPVMKAGVDGSVVVMGTNVSTNADVIIKLTPQATLDTSFGNNGKVRVSDDASWRYVLSDLEIQPDGMLVIGGSRVAVPGNDSQQFGNPPESVLARLTARGTLDTGFGTGGLSVLTLPDRDGIDRIALEQNGKILAAGTTTAIATDGTRTDRPFLVRTLPNGQIDSSFQQQILADEAETIDLVLGDAAYLQFLPPFAAHEIRKFFIDPAPRSSGLNDDQTPSASGFRVDVLNAPGVRVTSARTSHVLGVHGYIYPQTVDLGANADVFVVVATARGWYMRTTDGTFVPWSGNLSELEPAYENGPLTAQTYVSIHGGALPFTGTYTVYLGYRIDGGPLIYSEEPAVLQITE